MRLLALGLCLSVVVTTLMVLAWGPGALLAGLSAGAAATLIQVVATRKLRTNYRGTNAQFFAAVGAGMGLRILGVAAVLAAILIDPVRFAPLPTAFGYLGVVIPLLFLEVRLVR